jgi:uncharacterized protein
MRRTVIDTNVYVSRALRNDSVPALAVNRAWMHDDTLLSDATWLELQLALRRPKFAPYLQASTLDLYLEKVRLIATFVTVRYPIHACRDPRDDKFLEVAVHGQADVIVSGDKDLLALHPFRGIAILSPREYMDRD